MPTLPTLFFDLDGTLTDSKPGITRCIQYALEKLGHTAPPVGELGWCVGPPLKPSFARLLQSDDPALLDRAIVLYRERFSTVGLFENDLYPDVLATLAALQGAGYRQFIVTAKPHVYARRIAAHFGLAPPIEIVYGCELDGTRGDKGDLIAHVLQEHGMGQDDAVMIGDREHDMRAAARHGLRRIGVLWGYGDEEELRLHGAQHLAEGMHALPELIRKSFSV